MREQVGILMNGASVPPQVTWDNEELAARVAAMAAGAEVSPVDATITRQNGRYVVTPSTSGVSFDTQQVVALAMAAVNNLSPASTQIAVEGAPVVPAVTTEQAQTAADRAERVVSSALTVTGEDLSTTIDAETIRGWVHLDEIAHGEWYQTVESAPVAQYLTAYAAETDIPPPTLRSISSPPRPAHPSPSSPARRAAPLTSTRPQRTWSLPSQHARTVPRRL